MNYFNDNARVVKCYGVSQNPTTKDYVMIMNYVRGGNLREHLQNNANKLDLKKKLIQLHSICESLNNIHEKGLVHKDFHSGNILSSGTGVYFDDLVCSITDLGLCQPANVEKNNKIYGVLPYIAPEVLREKKYTKAADIYSFGVVAAEIISGKPPHYDLVHEEFLAIRICQGLRPKFEVKIPLLLEDLINKCWDADQEKRPTTGELLESLTKLRNEIKNKNSEFYQQVQEVEKFNKELLDETKFLNYKTHPRAIYTSRCLDFKNLPAPQNSKEINKQFWESENLELDLATFNLNQIINGDETEQNINWQNIHPHFTSELIQLWQNYNFTVAEAQDWININSLTYRLQALQEPDYYAWLRDIKRVDSDWVLNQGNNEQLKKEYQNYLHQKYQTQIEIPPKNQ